MPSFASRLNTVLEPWDTGPTIKGKTDFERWLNAIAAMFEEVLELVEETGADGEAGFVPAWGKVFNPETCPNKALAYLGQFVGVPVREGATEAEARAEVKAESGLARGTKASLEALLKKALGSLPFVILERTKAAEGDDAYWVTIIIPKGSIPEKTYEEVNLTIPAGVWYTVVEHSNTWFAGAKKWSEIAAGKTWTTIKEGEY